MCDFKNVNLATYLPFNITLPPLVSEVLTTLALAGLMNALNLIDGVDGLASWVVLTALLAVISYQAFV